MKLSDCEKIAFESCRGFWFGFAGHTVIMAAVKVWIMANGSQKTVSEITRGFGTPLLRRNIAVCMTASMFTYSFLKTKNFSEPLSFLAAFAISHSLMSRVTHFGYRCVQIPVIVTTIGLFFLEFKRRRNAAIATRRAEGWVPFE